MPVSDSVLHTMVDAIVREVNPAQIILFGSAGRGEATADSDVDLLIISDEEIAPRKKREILHSLRLELAGVGVAKDLLLCSKAYVAEWRDSLNHVIGRALREGRILYERP